MRRLTVSIMTVLALVSVSVAASAAQPSQIKEVSGIRFTVPAGTALPSDKILSDAVRQAQGPGNRAQSGTFPMFWYEETSSWDDHSPWKLGSTFTNSTNRDTTQTLTVTGTVTSTFSGGFAAKQVLSLGYDFSYSESIAASNQVTIPPGEGRAIWGSAWRTNHRGKVHWDWMYDWKYVRGGVTNVSFAIPYASAWDVTNYRRGAAPPRPTW